MTGPRTSGADPRRRRAWWIVALLTGLAVACCTGTFLVGRLAADHSSATRTITRPVKLLRIDDTGGSVTVDAGPPGQVRLREDLDWVLRKPKVEHRWDGDTLLVTVLCPDGSGPFHALGCRADVRIEVPADTAVQSVAAAGSTTVSGISGAVDLSAGSGPVTLTAVVGPVTVSTASGPVQGDGLRSPRVQVQSTSGPITLNFAAAPAVATVGSTSGPIDIGVPRGPRYRATARSASGPASVGDGLDDPAATSLLTATSASGPVDIDYLA